MSIDRSVGSSQWRSSRWTSTRSNRFDHWRTTCSSLKRRSSRWITFVCCLEIDVENRSFPRMFSSVVLFALLDSQFHWIEIRIPSKTNEERETSLSPLDSFRLITRKPFSIPSLKWHWSVRRVIPLNRKRRKSVSRLWRSMRNRFSSGRHSSLECRRRRKSIRMVEEFLSRRYSKYRRNTLPCRERSNVSGETKKKKKKKIVSSVLIDLDGYRHVFIWNESSDHYSSRAGSSQSLIGEFVRWTDIPKMFE